MIQALKVLSVFTFSLYFLLCPVSVNAHWSQLRIGDKPMHFYLILLSYDKFEIHSQKERNELFNILFAGSNDPDEHKSLSHDNPDRIRFSLCAALRDRYGGNNTMATRRLARSFHYLADYADPTDKAKNKNKLRQQAYDFIKEKYNKMKSDPIWNQAISTYSPKVRTSTFETLMAYAKAQTAVIATALDGPSANEKSIHENLIRSFALIKVCQDRLIDLLKEEQARDASVICRKQPVFCNHARDKIREVCKAKDYRRAKVFIDRAVADKCDLSSDINRCYEIAVCGPPLTREQKDSLVNNFLKPFANKWTGGSDTYRGLRGLIKDANYYALQYEFNVPPWKGKVTCSDEALRSPDCIGRTANRTRCDKRLKDCNVHNKMWKCPKKESWW
jgi:hypothetical protein